MPYAQHHYPFEQKIASDSSSRRRSSAKASIRPEAGFIRCMRSVCFLHGGPAFENCIVLGHILDDQGRKMSKRLGNIVDPWTVLSAEGADALRYYLYTASPPGQPRRFSQALVQKSLRQFLLTLWNCYSFTSPTPRWVSSTRDAGSSAGGQAAPRSLDPGLAASADSEHDDGAGRYDITQSARGIADSSSTSCPTGTFVAVGIASGRASTVRAVKSAAASRRDKRAAYQTLHTCLVTIAQLVAPFAPFIAEELWQTSSVASIRRRRCRCICRTGRWLMKRCFHLRRNSFERKWKSRSRPSRSDGRHGRIRT